MKTAVVILAAGLGTRLKKLTEKCAKPMLLIEGRPLLDHTLTHLVKLGFQEIGMNLFYFPEQIRGYFRDGQDFHCHIHYSLEATPSGTAGGVRSLSSYLSNFDNFLVIYGDLLTDTDYRKLLSFHLDRKALASLYVHQRRGSNSLVEITQAGQVKNFWERPSEEEKIGLAHLEPWVNSGIYCFKKEILSLLPDEPLMLDFPKDIFPKLLAKKQLFALPMEGKRIAIDSEEAYLRAQKEFAQFEF